MKKISFIVATAIIASAATSSLASCAGSLYGGADIGYTMIPGKVTGSSTIAVGATGGTAINTTIPANPATPNSGKLKATGKGGIATVKLGYHLSDEIRTDLSFGYLFNQTNTLNKESVVAPITTNAAPQLQRKSWLALANMYYHFKNSSDFEPFVGLSLGYGSTEYQVKSVAYATTTGLPVGANAAWVGQILNQTGSDTKKSHKSFVYGGTLGVAYKMSNEVDLDLYYGLRSLAKAQTQIASYTGVPTAGTVGNAGYNPGTPVADDVLVQYKAPSLMHSINLGVRVSF
jgi:opacity protein-like surface antigen